MRELLGELWGLVGNVVHVIRRGVELDTSENCDRFDLQERSAHFNNSNEEFGYLWGGNGSFREIESADGGHH